MGLFDNMREPVFLKENSSAKEQIPVLTAMLKIAPREIKAQMEQDIKFLSAGLRAEDQVALELKNSRIPMFVFRDLYLSDGSLDARMDFLVITRGRNFVLECRDLFGDIEMNSAGDFIRMTSFDGHYVKKSISSPILSGRRNLELIRRIRRENRRNLLSALLFDKNFHDNYRSAAVLADPLTNFSAQYTKKEITNQVIRAGQLAEYINKVNAEPVTAGREKNAEQLAYSFLALQQETPKNYTEKYRLMFEAYRERCPE